MNQYYVYILTNSWRTVFYVGMTNDIEARVYEHKTKVNKGFSNKYNVDRLVYFEIYVCIWDAIAREKELKKWRREWKEKLIIRENPGWWDLSVGWYEGERLVTVLERVAARRQKK